MKDVLNNSNNGEFRSCCNININRLKRLISEYKIDPSVEISILLFDELVKVCAYDITFFSLNDLYRENTIELNYDGSLKSRIVFSVGYFRKDCTQFEDGKIEKYKLLKLFKQFLKSNEIELMYIKVDGAAVHLSKEIASMIVEEAITLKTIRTGLKATKENRSYDIALPTELVYTYHVIDKLFTYENTRDEDDKTKLLEALADACLHDVHFYCPSLDEYYSEEDVNNAEPEIDTSILYKDETNRKIYLIFTRLHSMSYIQTHHSKTCYGKDVRLINILRYFVENEEYFYIGIDYNDVYPFLIEGVNYGLCDDNCDLCDEPCNGYTGLSDKDMPTRLLSRDDIKIVLEMYKAKSDELKDKSLAKL